MRRICSTRTPKGPIMTNRRLIRCVSMRVCLCLCLSSMAGESLLRHGDAVASVDPYGPIVLVDLGKSDYVIQHATDARLFDEAGFARNPPIVCAIWRHHKMLTNGTNDGRAIWCRDDAIWRYRWADMLPVLARALLCRIEDRAARRFRSPRCENGAAVPLHTPPRALSSTSSNPSLAST